MQRYEQKMTVSIVVTDSGESEMGIVFEPEMPKELPDIMSIKEGQVKEQAQLFIASMAGSVMSDMYLDKTEMKKPVEWAAEEGITILDQDGWRGADAKDFNQRVTKAEYLRRVQHCTISGVPNGRHS